MSEMTLPFTDPRERFSRPMVLSLWRGLIPAPRSHPRETMHDICRAVAAEHGLSLAQLRSSSRERRLVIARQEAMAEMVAAGRFDLSAMGRVLNRDRSTVRFGAKAHRARISLPQQDQAS